LSSVPTPHEGPTTGEPPADFVPRLGLFDSTMLVVGTMIGSGIFIVSASMARDLGSSGWLIAAWVLTGLITVIGALTYAELAAMMPHAGGQYVYLREAFSPLWAFMYGWTLFLVIQTGSIAAVAVAFAKFLGVLVPALGVDPKAGAAVLFEHKFANPINIALPLPWLQEPLTIFRREEFVISAGHLVAVAVTAFLTLVNCAGVREGKWIQNIFSVTKTAGLAIVIIVGLAMAADQRAISMNFANAWEGISTTEQFQHVDKLVGLGGLAVALMVLGGSLVGSLFSADAWNNVTFTAGEVRNPRRNLPLSLVIGTIVVISLYILANFAYLAALPMRGDPVAAKIARDEKKQSDAIFLDGIDHASDDRVAAAVMARAWPDLGLPFIAVAVMISTFGCINGMVLMGARLYYAMAQDRLFFRSVGKLNNRGVPAAGLVLQGLWSILLIFSGTYSELLDYVIFAALLFYALTATGLFVLRRKRPNAPRPYRVYGYPFIPLLYIFLCLVIMLDLLIVKPEYTWPGLAIVATGIPVYFIWRSLGKAAI
jgi:APA family basic amino acid/polyamine antiporter